MPNTHSSSGCVLVLQISWLIPTRINVYSKWAVHENADFRATDLVLFVRNVVLRISVFSVAMQRFGGWFPPVRRWEGDMVQLRVVPYHPPSGHYALYHAKEMYHYAAERLFWNAPLCGGETFPSHNGTTQCCTISIQLDQGSREILSAGIKPPKGNKVLRWPTWAT